MNNSFSDRPIDVRIAARLLYPHGMVGRCFDRIIHSRYMPRRLGTWLWMRYDPYFCV